VVSKGVVRIEINLDGCHVITEMQVDLGIAERPIYKLVDARLGQLRASVDMALVERGQWSGAVSSFRRWHL
jgi:hypothetical protein